MWRMLSTRTHTPWLRTSIKWMNHQIDWFFIESVRHEKDETDNANAMAVLLTLRRKILLIEIVHFLCLLVFSTSLSSSLYLVCTIFRSLRSIFYWLNVMHIGRNIELFSQFSRKWWWQIEKSSTKSQLLFDVSKRNNTCTATTRNSLKWFCEFKMNEKKRK